MTDPYKNLVNTIRKFDKNKLLTEISLTRWSVPRRLKSSSIPNEKLHFERATLPRIAVLAAAIAGTRNNLKPSNHDIQLLINYATKLLLISQNENGENLLEIENNLFISKLKELGLTSDIFDKKYNSYKYKLYPALRLAEIQNESHAFYGKAYILLLRSFAIAKHLNLNDIDIKLTDQQSKSLIFNLESDFNLLYLLAYLIERYGIIDSKELLTIKEDFKLKGVSDIYLKNLLVEFSIDKNLAKRKYDDFLNMPWYERFIQPNILRSTPLIKISEHYYIAPSPDHFITKISSLVIDRIYNIKSRSNKLLLANAYGNAITNYLHNGFLLKNPQINFLNIDQIKKYPKDTQKADFILYGKNNVLIIEVKAKLGSARTKTLSTPTEVADSVNRMSRKTGYPQCKATWEYMKKTSLYNKLTPLFIIVVNDDAITFSKLFYNLYHHDCLKVEGEKHPLEIMNLHDFERLILAFNDIDLLAEEIITHQANLEINNTAPFAEVKKTSGITYPHLNEYDRLGEALNENT